VATFVPGREVDDAVAAAVSFAGGAIGTIEATRFATGNLNRFTWEINGSKRSLAFDLERLNELVIDGERTLVNPDGWWPPGHVIGWEHTFVFELRRFLDAVAGRGAVEPHGATFEDGVRAAEVCDAILASARDGRHVQPGA
jgi:predicted dehydrogenase